MWLGREPEASSQSTQRMLLKTLNGRRPTWQVAAACKHDQNKPSQLSA